MPETLAQKIKAKYPGQYDDLPDAELEAKITAKFPGVYDDIPKTAASGAPPAAAAPAAPERTWGDTAADLAIGAVKGAGNTVYGLGKVVHDYTPIGRISDAIQPGAFEDANKPPELTPTNAAQRVGQGVEQVGEFFLPTGAAGKVGKVAEVGKAGLLTLAQGGSPTSAGVSAGLTAAFPVVGSAVSKLSGPLERGAQREMAQALGATKEWAKAEATKLAPEMLKRGVGGSRAAMLNTAKEAASRVGANLDQAYTAAAQAGQAVPSNIIAGNVQLARDALMTTLSNGARVTIPGTEPVVSKLNELADFVLTLGPDVPVDKAAHIKRTWDGIVSKAGLFGPKATASATDSAHAWAIREASGAFRDLLNANPTIADLNKEAAFWTGLKNVLKETQKRTQAQAGTGLVAAGTGGAGAVAGALSGDSTGDRATRALLGGLAGRQLVKLVQSPAFKTMVTAKMKHELAQALASNSPGLLTGSVQKVVASLPAQMREQFAP